MIKITRPMTSTSIPSVPKNIAEDTPEKDDGACSKNIRVSAVSLNKAGSS